MERLEFQEGSHIRALIGGSKWRRNTLRYGPIIILLETIVILLLLSYFIYTFVTPSQESNQTPNDYLSNHILGPTPNTYIIYSNGTKHSRKLLASLVQGCDLRKHDFKFGVRCNSSNTAKCNIPLKIESFNSINYEFGNLSRMKRAQEVSSEPIATQIITSKAGLRLHVKHVSMKRIVCNKNQLACQFKTKLVIFPTRVKQKIIGFGGALTDSSINNILSLTVNGTKQLLDDYFGINGLRYNMVRITIGGSDFSGRFYTNDDVENKKEDLKLEKFKLREEDILYKIPMLKDLLANFKDNNLKVFASMWSPPIWMKNNNHHNKGFIKGSISSNLLQKNDQEKYYNTLANFKKKFILSYLAEGIKLWGMTVVNEPVMAKAPFLTFNSIVFDKTEYGDYVAKYLGPIFKEDHRLADIKIIALDDNRKFIPKFVEPILKRPEVRKYLDGVATHGYIDEEYHHMDSVYNENDDGNFFILPDELCSAHLPYMQKALIGNWDRAIHYGLDIIRGLQHSAAGWVDWNMVLDTEGGPGWFDGRLDSPVIVNKQQDAYYKSPMFYAIGQFSRYLPTGSRKLETNIMNDQYDYYLETVAFLTPNKQDIVLIILNNNPYSIELNINQMNNLTSFSQDVEDVFYVITAPADSISTYIFANEKQNL